MCIIYYHYSDTYDIIACFPVTWRRGPVGEVSEIREEWERKGTNLKIQLKYKLVISKQVDL